jgi:hypothetical protein
MQTIPKISMFNNFYGLYEPKWEVYGIGFTTLHQKRHVVGMQQPAICDFSALSPERWHSFKVTSCDIRSRLVAEYSKLHSGDDSSTDVHW